MKKILIAGVLFMLAAVGKISAHAVKHQIGNITIEDFNRSPTNATGPQTIVVPNGRGELKFDKNGDKFTNIVFIEATGLKNHRALLISSFPKTQMQTPCIYLRISPGFLPDCFEIGSELKRSRTD